MIASAGDEGNLSDILRDFKKFTSKSVIETRLHEICSGCCGFANLLFDICRMMATEAGANL
jgi:hypothetical protein